MGILRLGVRQQTLDEAMALRTWSLLLLVASLSAVVHGANRYCSYFGNRAPAPQPGLQNCTWYRESSCCLQEEINSLFPAVSPPLGANKRCRNYVNYLMCYVCAPTQSSFYLSERLTVCESFCNDFYDACKDAQLNGMRISSLYANGRAFCQDRKYTVSTQSEICFTLDPSLRTLSDSAATSLGVNAIVVQLCAFIGVLFNVIPSGRWRAGTLLLLALFMLGRGGAQLQVPNAAVIQMASEVEKSLVDRSANYLSRDDFQREYNGPTNDITLQPSMILAAIKAKLESITGDLENAVKQIQTAVTPAFTNSPPVANRKLNDLPSQIYEDADYGPSQQKLTYTFNG